MSDSGLLSRLRKLNVRLWSEAGQLRYEAPKGVMTPGLLEEIRAEKSALIELLRNTVSDNVPPVTAVSRTEQLPLSFSQQRLWLLDQLTPGNPAYNMPVAMRLRGALDIEALERGLNEIIRRHEVLRTCLVNENGMGVQRILPELRLVLDAEEVPAVDSAQREVILRDRLVEESLRPFDLAGGVLVRAHLWRLSNEDHAMLLVVHHVAFDRWSASLMFRELAALYSAFQAGKTSPLSPLAIQYADFAVWQRATLQGPELAAQLDYWRERLEGVEPLQLPADKQHAQMQTYNGKRETRRIPAHLVQALKEMCRNEGVTLYMLLLTAFQVLLQRYTGQADITVGSPIAGRHRAETEGLIGFFVNMLVLRTDLSGDPLFRDLLDQVRTNTLDAFSRQDVPYEQLLKELGMEGEAGGNALFQVVFALQNSAVFPSTMGDLQMQRQQVDNATTRFDLEMHLEEIDDGLSIIAAYNSDRFQWESIQRLLEHYEILLRGIAEDPNRKVSCLPVMGEQERERVLTGWNQTQTNYPREQTVSGLFEEQASIVPDAVAVEFGTQQLTYSALNERANRLAHYLRSRGVGPEVMVAICTERSLEMVVGLLGILKAGGAYVPLAPDYPQARLEFMLEDTGAQFLLTLSSLAADLPGFAGEVICLDSDWPAIETESSDNPVPATTPASLMYVIYTSGSTGRPKGVCVEHHSAVRLVKNTNYVELGPDEVFLQFAPISFDASTFELWGSLLNGSRLVIFPPEQPSLKELGRFIEDKGITTLWLTSALFSQMVEQQLPRLAGVRQLLAGGETLSVPHVQKMLAQLGDHRLVNGYGPTENTTFTCCHVMTADSHIEDSVPVGCPVSNTTVYILDTELNPVPIGVFGELYTGGDGVARGYLNRPELTAEKFITDPFSDRPGARLYNTGDLARFRADGSIEFRGRQDRQVKIRGFRIELGEIEAALRGVPGISEVVVTVREDVPGDKRLIAYVTGQDAERPDVAGLRDYLSGSLPGYMVPSAFVLLDTFPLTPNGKLDLEALPQPEAAEELSDAAASDALSSSEEIVAEIWRDLLQVGRVGLHDNFFEAGGHSLLATQLVNRFEEYFGLEVPLMRVFELPTISEQAACIESMLLEEMQDSSSSG